MENKSSKKNESNLQSVAEMLEKASKMLRGVSSSDQQSTSNTSNISNVTQAMENARAMIRSSTSSGTFRRLNRTERLRSAPYPSKKPQVKQASKKKKAMEFALLKCFDGSTDEDDHNLKWDSAIANGITTVDEEANEDCIRKLIKDSVSSKFPLIQKQDFEFVKVRQKKITKLELGPGTEYDYTVVKKMIGQGILYVKVKEGFECLYEDANDSDDLLEIKPSNRKSSNESDSSDKPSTVEQSKDTISDNESSFETPEKVLEDKPTTINPYQYLIDEIADMSDPVELLRYLQKRLIKGRKLDISTASDVDPEELQNATNYISVTVKTF